MATTRNKRTTARPKATPVTPSPAAPELSIWQRWALRRAEKKQTKQSAKTHAAQQAKTIKAKQQRAEAQAAKQAVKATALAQVEKAVDRSRRRRSHPFTILFLLAIVMALAGAVVWIYRGQELVTKNNQISQLQQQIADFSQQQASVQAAKQAEAAKFQTVSARGISMRLPVSWQQQPTQFPADETIYGNDNVSLQIISSDNRNSIGQYIPQVDYLWQIAGVDNNPVAVSNQSLACDRFDTLDNNLSSPVRTHNGFRVYCDTHGGQLVIAALGNPDHYGVGSRNVYFIIIIRDVQQVSLNDVKGYIQSARPN